MRFNNEMYLKAFPRDDKPAQVQNTITKPQPAGDVFDEEIKPDPSEEPDQVEEVKSNGDQSGQGGTEAQ